MVDVVKLAAANLTNHWPVLGRKTMRSDLPSHVDVAQLRNVSRRSPGHDLEDAVAACRSLNKPLPGAGPVQDQVRLAVAIKVTARGVKPGPPKVKARGS